MSSTRYVVSIKNPKGRGFKRIGSMAKFEDAWQIVTTIAELTIEHTDKLEIRVEKEVTDV